MEKFTSIIMVHYAMDEHRSELMQKSVFSLIDSTDSPYELIVVDNGKSHKDSLFLMTLTDAGKITTYIRNSQNMHFGYARNQGITMAHGHYVSIVDNDLIYSKGWLKRCTDILEAFPEAKYYATPIPYPTIGLEKRYHDGFVKHEGIDYQIHQRAGSNCFVIRRSDFDTIGRFRHHRIAGSYWTDSAVRAGYRAIVVPGNPVLDMGLREGYDLSKDLPVEIKVFNGQPLVLNEGK